jgi:hypothetical protein
MQRTIPDKHRDKLITAGYIREVVRSGGVSALALTGAGIRRLEFGNAYGHTMVLDYLNRIQEK